MDQDGRGMRRAMRVQLRSCSHSPSGSTELAEVLLGDSSILWREEMSSNHNMLIPTDFSPQSQAAVDYGVQMAKTLGSEIYLLHVYQEPLIVPSGPSVPMTPQVTGWLKDIQDRALKQLDVMAKEVESRVKKVKPIFKVGIPFFEIVKAVEEIPADLIVMGTHGRTGLAHFMMGSVAELVVRKSPCPVLTVKPTGLKNLGPWG